MKQRMTMNNEQLFRRNKMKKPQVKRELAVTSILEGSFITFQTKSNDCIDDVREFGRVSYCKLLDNYTLYVHACYDFDEVLEYMKDYGS